MIEVFSSLREMLKQGEKGTFFVDIEKYPGRMALYDIKGKLRAGEDFITREVRGEIQKSSRSGVIEIEEGKIYGEFVEASPVLVIFGGGHIAKPLAEIGKLIGMRVWVLDDRAEFASGERFPMAEKVISGPFEDFFQHKNIGSENYLVIVTRGHKHDLICAREALKTEASYIGMIGSRRKVEEVFQKLREEGFSDSDLNRIHAPIGLDIGAETPAEIAVSIAAEVIGEKKGKADPGNWQEILPYLERGSILATVVSARGSTPRGMGARLLLRPDGSMFGTVGGGLGEGKVVEKAKELQGTGRTFLMDFELNQDIAAEEGMICGGSFSVFIQQVE